MRRLLAAMFLVGASTIIPITGAGAGPADPALPDDDASGPPCAEIRDGAVSYESGVLNFRLDLRTDPCASVLYPLTAASCPDPSTNCAAGAPLVTSTDWSVDPVDGTRILFSTPVPGAPSTICVSASSGKPKGPSRFDQAPDAGCVPVTDDGTSPGVRFR
jgi:hypothetical protein